MSFNIFNKKRWSEELDKVTDFYIDFIDQLSETQEKIDLDVVLSKKYSSSGLHFTGQEIIDNIRKKLSNDVNYSYEFRTVDDRPVITRDFRVFTDDKIKARVKDISFEDRDGNVHRIKNDNVLVTIEDLKSKLVDSLNTIAKLNKEIDKRKEENKLLFLDIIEASGGLYPYVVSKRWILMLNRVLKELGLYKTDVGVEHSYGRLNDKQKQEVLDLFFEKIYK